jgi:lactoylglutathione lyase
MQYLHTMIRISNIEESLDFYCNKLGLTQTTRKENEKGRFTLIFLSAPDDLKNAKINKAPLIELTYNWPDENGKVEEYKSGRNFGHLAFGVDNIYEFCQKLIDKGLVINRPPKDGYMAFIKSPDGISIELLQKGDSLEVCEPWKSMENVGSW